MAKSTSATQKTNYKRYDTEGRREFNSSVRLECHLKKHPNDDQSRKRIKPSIAGRRPDVITDPRFAAIERAVAHDRLFGQDDAAKVKERDLSTKAARAELLAPAKKAVSVTSTAKKAA